MLVARTGASSDDEKWLSKSYMIGALIWLCILSFIVIVFLIVLIILTALYNRRKQDLERKRAELEVSDEQFHFSAR
jgi:uncharacterized membrane protein